MAEVIGLNDDELHAELLLHGITTPVTATTRSILRKKLSIARKGKSSKKYVPATKTTSRRSLQAFSSDEDEDDQEEEQQDEEEDEDDENILDRSYSSTGTNRSSLFKYNTHVVTRNKGTPTSSWSSPATKSSTPTYLKTKPSNASQSGMRSSSRQKPKPAFDYDTASDNDDAITSQISGNSSSARQRFNDRFMTPDLGDVRKVPKYQYHEYNDSRHGSYDDPSEYYKDQDTNGDTSSYAPEEQGSKSKFHGFNSWLANLFGNKNKNAVSKPSSNGFSWKLPKVLNKSYPSSPNSSYFPASSPPPSPSFFPNYCETRDSSSSSWCPSVSNMLLLLLTLFFSLLALSYFSMIPPDGLLNPDLQHLELESTGSSAWDEFAGKQFEENGLKLPICPAKGAPGEVGKVCLSAAEVRVAPQVLGSGRQVVVEAERRHAQYQCGAAEAGYLTVKETSDLIAEKFPLKDDELLLGVSALAKLSCLNPSLGLSPVLTSGWSADPEGRGWPDEALQGLSTSRPQLQLLCALMNLATLALAALALVALGAAVFWAVLWVIRGYQRRQQQHQQQVYAVVRKILQKVRGARDGLAAVSHVRDELLSPEQRLSCARVWRDAVAFVERHESRLVREMRLVGGEECEVWRWIGGNSSQCEAAEDIDDVTRGDNQSQATPGPAVLPDVRRTPGPAVLPDVRRTPSMYPDLPVDDDNDADPSGQWWRGVGEREAAVTAPTQCLKIRNLARPDKSATWVREVVLQKCRGLPVLHLAVDQHGSEGLVYLMAKTVKTAGQIHSLLHGIWFEGQLVSVKFLRRERYCERFPAAVHCTVPLSPASH
ncbi:uncharacterized protein LOC108671176 [Hyalella azteca]|uniref:Uncharacterized protein LOC108671176 n=1 Tax=Hyalella azteca TaxID=294128 RepID=A0A8B7NKH3_HYAAZ|nr:uncharacterized protein LOC108671176 [Hyalella azteca]